LEYIILKLRSSCDGSIGCSSRGRSGRVEGLAFEPLADPLLFVTLCPAPEEHRDDRAGLSKLWKQRGGQIPARITRKSVNDHDAHAALPLPCV
jgi:hypothetical protein